MEKRRQINIFFATKTKRKRKEMEEEEERQKKERSKRAERRRIISAVITNANKK